MIQLRLTSCREMADSWAEAGRRWSVAVAGRIGGPAGTTRPEPGRCRYTSMYSPSNVLSPSSSRVTCSP
ncbi:hypothetical protein BRC88_10470 [Halobacteriales archaeon QS_4_69_225]|nr:MAG: hypothetical protein BRC88_10470 [Halobacteriales archaeon QS_4_69_225]